MDGKSNNNMVSRVALFSEISKLRNIHSIENINVETNSMNVSTYTLPISIYRTEATGTYKNARGIATERAYTYHTSLVVRTDGHGSNGSDEFKTRTLTQQIEENKDKLDDIVEIGISI